MMLKKISNDFLYNSIAKKGLFQKIKKEAEIGKFNLIIDRKELSLNEQSYLKEELGYSINLRRTIIGILWY